MIQFRVESYRDDFGINKGGNCFRDEENEDVLKEKQTKHSEKNCSPIVPLKSCENKIKVDTISETNDESKAKCETEMEQHKSDQKKQYTDLKDASVKTKKRKKKKRINGECPYCDFKTFRSYVLRHHITEAHNKEINCQKCDFKTSKWEDMKVHKAGGHDKVTYCGKCDLNFSNIWRHLKKYHGESEESHPCSECSYIAHGFKFLERHHSIVHDRIELDCKHCKFQAFTIVDLAKHADAVHGKVILFEKTSRTPILKDAVQCEKCGKGFKSGVGIQEHTEKCETFECVVCSKTIARLDLYKKHLKGVSHKEKSGEMFQCSECDKQYKRKAHLMDHVKYQHLVDFENRFRCDQCGKKFVTKRNLEFHVNAHLGIKPYKCSFCPQDFVNNSNCFAHKKKKHPELFAAERFRCVQCGESCRSLEKLETHTNNT